MYLGSEQSVQVGVESVMVREKWRLKVERKEGWREGKNTCLKCGRSDRGAQVEGKG